jgi:hypothetical protein
MLDTIEFVYSAQPDSGGQLRNDLRPLAVHANHPTVSVGP